MATAKAQQHHYAIDAASLLEKCLMRLRETIDLDTRSRHKDLFDEMEVALANTERHLHAYMIQLIALERETIDEDGSDHVPATLSECSKTLQTVMYAKKQKQRWSLQVHQVKRSQNRARNRRKKEKEYNAFMDHSVDRRDAGGGHDVIPSFEPAGDSSVSGAIRPTFDQSRSATDTLLFRLIVALQLCLVRIDDARFVITGRRYHEDATLVETSWSPVMIGVAGAVCMLGIGSVWMIRSRGNNPRLRMHGLLCFSGKITVVAFAGKLMVNEWGNVWMTAKIRKSTAAVKEWQQQWLFVQTTADSPSGSLTPEARSQRLIEYALSQSPKVSLFDRSYRAFLRQGRMLSRPLIYSHRCGIQREKYDSCFLSESWIFCMPPSELL